MKLRMFLYFQYLLHLPTTGFKLHSNQEVITKILKVFMKHSSVKVIWLITGLLDNKAHKNHQIFNVGAKRQKSIIVNVRT